MGADGVIRNVAGAALNAVVDGEMADGAESFIIKRRNAESGAEFFVEFAKTLKMGGQRGDLEAVIVQQEFLVTGVPEARELAPEHDGRRNGHREETIRAFAKLGAGAIFFHANNAAGAADGESESSQAFDSLRLKTFFDIPHNAPRVKKEKDSVKWRRARKTLKTGSRCEVRGVDFKAELPGEEP